MEERKWEVQQQNRILAFKCQKNQYSGRSKVYINMLEISICQKPWALKRCCSWKDGYLWIMFFGSQLLETIGLPFFCFSPWKNQLLRKRLLQWFDQQLQRGSKPCMTRARWHLLSWIVFFQRGSWKILRDKPIWISVASCVMNGTSRRITIRTSKWWTQLESCLACGWDKDWACLEIVWLYQST